ncbi:polymorphic toxin type 46 domain-containing protein [Pseudomonas lini]
MAGSATAGVENVVANTAARQATANGYYKTLGWDDTRIASHTSGIDFSKPVEVVMLPKGAQFVQYQIPGNPVGGYFVTDP